MLALVTTPEGRADLRRNYSYDPVVGILTLNKALNPDVDTVYESINEEDYHSMQVYIDNQYAGTANIRQVIWAVHFDRKPPARIYRAIPGTRDLRIDSFTPQRRIARHGKKPDINVSTVEDIENYITNLTRTEEGRQLVSRALFAAWKTGNLGRVLTLTNENVNNYAARHGRVTQKGTNQ